jgi:hypothetical protein
VKVKNVIEEISAALLLVVVVKFATPLKAGLCHGKLFALVLLLFGFFQS